LYRRLYAAEYCLQYLAGSERGWVDADFAADLDTRRSHTGYVIMNEWRAYQLEVCEVEECISPNIKLVQCGSNKMVADALTKNFPLEKHNLSRGSQLSILSQCGSNKMRCTDEELASTCF
jgi:hypothetical protein